MVSELDCYNFLDSSGIAYEVIKHGAVFTIKEANEAPELDGRIELKNLFIQNEKGTKQYLVILPGYKKLDLKELASILSEKKLRFCSPEKVENRLGVLPGSVSIFCSLNDNAKDVCLIVDKEVLTLREVGFHPIINTATVFISQESFYKLLNLLPVDHMELNL